ncbi:MAG TPA: glycosyltransferase family 39 protein [Acidimicrobiales bacterium]|nr:glycosyltransferase family 39 protein [Acidimicrobiales bacterium]
MVRTAAPAASEHSGAGDPERLAVDTRAAPPARRRTLLVVAGLLALSALATLLHLEALGISMWVDEAQSVGIASSPIAEIPGLLARDGSPPLYYLLLHPWMALFGTSEAAVRSLALVFATVTVPVAWWVARSLFGTRAAWLTAALVATSPYLAVYGRETRMYTLAVLLVLVSTTAFVQAFAYRRRRWLSAFVVTLALVLYTHNWGVFLALSMSLALVPCLVASDDRRRTVLDAALAFGGAALLYAPWVPTLLSQARHTAAPWSKIPVAREAVSVVGVVLGDERVLVALVVAAGVPLAVLALRPRTSTGAAVGAMSIMVVAGVAIAWLASQVQPAWADRYLGIFLAPMLLLAALGLSRAGPTGLMAFALVLLLWTQPLGRITGLRAAPASDEKSNVEHVATVLGTRLRAGDLVVSTQMEQVPVLRYYLGPSLRYADPTGLVDNPRVADWTDAVTRMAGADAAGDVLPLARDLPAGGHVALVCPLLTTEAGDAEWFRAMDLSCRSLRSALGADEGFRRVLGPVPSEPLEETKTPVFALLYQKR